MITPLSRISQLAAFCSGIRTIRPLCKLSRGHVLGQRPLQRTLVEKRVTAVILLKEEKSVRNLSVAPLHSDCFAKFIQLNKTANSKFVTVLTKTAEKTKVNRQDTRSSQTRGSLSQERQV